MTTMKEPSPRVKPKPPIPEFKAKNKWLNDYYAHHVAEELAKGMSVPLEPDVLKKLRALARAKHVRAGTLARMWVMERMRREEEREAKVT